MQFNSQPGSLGGSLLLQRKPVAENAEFDITAMVDLVFMMNIFFLVTWVGAALADVEMPSARHCLPADPEASVIFSVLQSGGREGAAVYLGDGASGRPLTDPKEIEERVRATVEARDKQKKDTVLIKGERRLRFRDVARVAAAASVEGVKIRLGVMEKE